MGWGTNFNTDIYLSRKVFSSRDDVMDAIDEINKVIESDKSQLKMYASSTPSDIIPEDNNTEPIEWIEFKIETIMGEIFELHRDLVKLYIYLEYLDENNITIIDKKAQQ